MPALCQSLQSRYVRIKTLNQEFVSAYEKAIKTRSQEDRDEARILQNKLIAEREVLENLLWPFKEMALSEFKEQYEFETEKTLQESNLIQEIPGTGQIGIKNYFPELIKEGAPEYFPLPTMEQIKRALREEKELYNEKMEQEFTRVQIIPVIPLRLMIQATEDTLKARPDILTKDDKTIQAEPINRWEEGYKYKANEGKGADETGELVYFPKKFDPNDHGGLTKQELLKKTLNTHTPGYIIELKQQDPLIPRATNDPTEIAKRTKAGRRQIEANKSPENYLKDLQDEQKKPNSKYQGETLITPDSRIIEFISQLKKGKLIGDYQNGIDSACLCLGAYFKNRDDAPSLLWIHVARQLFLGRRDGGAANSDDGASASAMVARLNF